MMGQRDDDDLLDRLGAIAREQAGDPPGEALERLAAGEVSPEDAAGDVTDDALAHAALAAMAPISPDRRAEMARAALAAFAQAEPARTEDDPTVDELDPRAPRLALLRADASPAASDDVSPAPREAPAGVVPLDGRRRWRWVVAAVPLAAAAAVALFLLSAQPEALPAYSLRARGGDQIERGPEHVDGRLPLSAGSQLEVVLTPTTRVDGPLEVSAYLLVGGALQPWDVLPEVAAGGGVRVRGTVETLGLGGLRGPLDLVLVVARAGHRPAVGAVQAALEVEAGTVKGSLVHRVAVERVP